MNPVVRGAVPEDADATGALHVRSWQVAYRGLLPDDYLDALDVAERQAAHLDRMENPVPEVRNWVVEDDGAVVGWAATGPPRDEDLGAETNEIYAIYLTPELVGGGFGRALMEHSLEDARERGFRQMTMWVLTGNERAQRFYAAAGFAPDPRVPEVPFRDTGATKLRMVRAL